MSASGRQGSPIVAHSHTMEYCEGERTPTAMQTGGASCKHNVEEERRSQTQMSKIQKQPQPIDAGRRRDGGLEGACDGLFRGFGAGFTNTFDLWKSTTGALSRMHTSLGKKWCQF